MEPIKCELCKREHDGTLMRTDKRYTRVRDMLRSECPHTDDGRIKVCKVCQRRAYFRGGFLKLLIWDVENAAKYGPNNTRW